MEYIEGQTITEALRQDGVFDEETAGRIIQDIASALDAAHQEDLIYRDLKPSHVMLCAGA